MGNLLRLGRQMSKGKFTTISVSRETAEAGHRWMVEHGYTSWNGFIRGVIAGHIQRENSCLPLFPGGFHTGESVGTNPLAPSMLVDGVETLDHNGDVRAPSEEPSRTVGASDSRILPLVQENPRSPPN